MIVHATSLSLFTPRGWCGVLIFGDSGVGKTDLALRAIEAGFRLVADDYSRLWASGQTLFATAPEQTQDLIEVRGLGIVREPARAFTPLHLAIKAQSQTPERLPDPEHVPLLGTHLPCLRVVPTEASALAKLQRALDCVMNPSWSGPHFVL